MFGTLRVRYATFELPPSFPRVRPARSWLDTVRARVKREGGAAPRKLIAVRASCPAQVCAAGRGMRRASSSVPWPTATHARTPRTDLTPAATVRLCLCPCPCPCVYACTRAVDDHSKRRHAVQQAHRDPPRRGAWHAHPFDEVDKVDGWQADSVRRTTWQKLQSVNRLSHRRPLSPSLSLSSHLPPSLSSPSHLGARSPLRDWHNAEGETRGQEASRASSPLCARAARWACQDCQSAMADHTRVHTTS